MNKKTILKKKVKEACEEEEEKEDGKGGYVLPMGFKSSTPERGPGLPLDIAPKPLVPNIKDAVTAAASMAQKAPTSPVSKIGIGMGKGQGLANRSSMGLRRGIGQARRAIINRIVKK